MAEVFAPFIVKGTMCSLTFYVMGGRNFVRTKSSLTRRKVLYAPCFKNSRHNAELMGQASKIGSLVYHALPVYWRQSWMYRSFTGEAFTLLKGHKKEQEVYEELWQRYVAIVIGKPPANQPQAAINTLLHAEPKRSYRKQNNQYWKNKTHESNRRKARKQQTLYYAGLLGRASKIGSRLYAQLPSQYKGRSQYQYLTGLALKLLKDQISEDDILAELLSTFPPDRPEEATVIGRQPTITKKVATLHYPHGQYYFIPVPRKRTQAPSKAAITGLYTTNVVSFNDT